MDNQFDVYNKVREPVILKRINELALNGMTWTGISDTLFKEFEYKFDSKVIKKAYEEISARRDIELVKDKNLMGDYKATLSKLFKTLDKQSKDMEEIWDREISKGIDNIKISELMSVAKETRERAKMVQDRLDRIDSPQAHNYNVYNFNQSNMKVFKDYLILLEKAGFIKKIKKYPFEEGGDTLDVIDVTPIEQ